MSLQPVAAQRALAVLVTLLVVGFYVNVFFLLPEFDSIFRNAGLMIPWHTQVVLDTYKFWFLFLVMALVGFALVWWRQSRHGWYLLVAAVVSVLVLMPFTIWALYQPVLL